MVYVLVALGLTLIFSILEIINFAHGEFYMLGGYVTYYVFAVFGLNYFAALYLFLRWSRPGRAMRAVAQDADAAALQGVDIELVSALGFGIGCALAGGAGGLLAPVFAVSPAMGALPVVKAFIIIIIGGMGSLPGAVVGGLLLGSVEGLGSLFMGSAALGVLGFLVVILALLVRPRGLAGGA